MVIQRYSNEMEPERTYSISEAARYLGVHRCTLYAYIKTSSFVSNQISSVKHELSCFRHFDKR